MPLNGATPCGHAPPGHLTGVLLLDRGHGGKLTPVGSVVHGAGWCSTVQADARRQPPQPRLHVLLTGCATRWSDGCLQLQ